MKLATPCLILTLALCGAGPVSTASVSTLAGSGAEGINDGRALTASFVMPTSIISDRAGGYYIIDAGAQRLRQLRNGRVTTLAGGGALNLKTLGWPVPGGYVDGPGLQARFDRPTALAMGPDGTLYIADAGNGVIRTYRDGVVATFAGRSHLPAQSARDGTRTTAIFSYPRALAFGPDQTLYVADYGTGIRIITPAGTVSTLRGAVQPTVDGVAIKNGRLFVTDHDGLKVFSVDGSAKARYADEAEGTRPFGKPDAILPISERAIFFTDADSNTVRFALLHPTLADSNPVIGTPIFDSTGQGAGASDGAFGSFNGPRGIARANDGGLVIADTGNRKIREISGFDERVAELPSSFLPSTVTTFVGGKFSFCNTNWSNSTPGLMELTAGPLQAVRYEETTPKEVSRAMRSVLEHAGRDVVWEVSSEEFEAADATSLREMFASVAAAAANLHRNLTTVLVPVGSQASPYEQIAATIYTHPIDAIASEARSRFLMIESAARAAPLTVLDLSATMLEEAGGPSHRPLFGSVDACPTPYGRAFIARAIIAHLRGSAIAMRVPAPVAAAPHLSAPGFPNVRASLVAGSGRVGIVDGPALEATFVKPTTIAYGPNHVLYVVDQGAQRVRKITPNGMVTTVAGSGALNPLTFTVPGGYRDGPAQRAQFNQIGGMAVTADGTIYLSDTLNKCIRKIAHGIVSTFTGSPQQQSAFDGAPSHAGFTHPLGLALDGRGGLYVGDYSRGLRHVAADGSVTTVSTPGISPYVFGAAIFHTGAKTMSFIASVTGVPGFAPFDLDGGIRSDIGIFNSEGRIPTGFPGGLQALSPHEMLIADPQFHTVQYFYFREGTGPFGRVYSVPVNGDLLEDAPNVAGGFDDGPPRASFDAPLGVALDPTEKSIIVSDAGNRRIRKIPMPDRRAPIADDLRDLQRNDKSYRIAYIGNSYAYHNVDWSHSIPGVLEATLRADAGRLHVQRPIKVIAIRFAPADIALTSSYITNVLAEGVVDAVVFGMNFAHIGNEYAVKDRFNINDPSTAKNWVPLLTADMRNLNKAVRKKHISLLIAVAPASTESDWLEGVWNEESFVCCYMKLDYRDAFRDNLTQALAASGAPYFMAYDQFRAAEQAPNRLPLFGNSDEHMSRAGASLFGHLIAKELEKIRPWRHTP